MPRINPMAMNPNAGASSPMSPVAGSPGPGGMMGMLGLNEQQGGALPFAMGLMGQGMTSLGGGQPQQPAPPAQAMNNPAAIQAAVQMMQQLRTQRGPGGMPQDRGMRRF